MKYRMLDLLVCPGCGGELQMRVFKKTIQNRSGAVQDHSCRICFFERYTSAHHDCSQCLRHEIVDAILMCSCGRSFAVIDTVPVMILDFHGALKQLARRHQSAIEALPDDWVDTTPSDADVRTRQGFAFEWNRYPCCFEEEERRIFLEETQIEPQLFQNRLTLDAGCGMGRFTRIAGSLGAEIVGIDASECVFRAAQLMMPFATAHIVQADIMHLPFRNDTFDIVYSLGVLHHTHNTRESFSAIVRKLKRGGLCSIWVYGTAGQYKDFRTNPLKPERVRYLTSETRFRLYWLGVRMREWLSRLLRKLTVRLPHGALYAACHIFALLGAIPIVKYLTYSVHQDYRVRVLENFDWLAPPFQHHHTKEEVLAWFRQEGLITLAILPHGFIPKVGVLGRKTAGICGKHTL